MVSQLNHFGHVRKTKKRTGTPYTEQGTNDEPLLMFNRHGNRAEQRLCEPKKTNKMRKNSY